jgi:phenylacetate-coenzyme A ligase PaaK-like adenylate-forming protein
MTTIAATAQHPPETASSEAERLRALAAELVARDAWPRERLLEHQRVGLHALLRYAVTMSPYYREALGAGAATGERPLADLPTLAKSTLMQEFDRIVTDPRLRLAEIEAHLAGPDAARPFLGDYRLFSTSGTTGLRGIFVYTGDEFASWIATCLRGIGRLGIGPSTRFASIGAPSPLHISNQLFAAFRAGRADVPELSVVTPLPDMVEALNAFRPEGLLAYASIAASLAQEQLEGRLRIAPRVVLVSSEVLTAEMRDRIRSAWTIEPHQVYASTELLAIAQTLPGRPGLHVTEDVAIVEVVDERNRPVPPGVPGHKVLITNLVNRAQPLIRYELSDSVTLAEPSDGAGQIASVDGRSDDILRMAAPGGGEVSVHPYRLRAPFSRLADVREYQVVHDGERLRVLVVLAAGAPRDTAERVRHALARELEAAGAVPPPIDVEPVAALAREPGAAGKFKLVKIERARPAG